MPDVIRHPVLRLRFATLRTNGGLRGWIPASAGMTDGYTVSLFALVAIKKPPASAWGLVTVALLCPLPASAPGGLLTILYIQPQASSSAEHTTDFARVARVVKGRGALGTTFAPYLRTGLGNNHKVLQRLLPPQPFGLPRFGKIGNGKRAT